MWLWSRIANVFRRERVSREIDEELRSHIEEALGLGRDPAEVRRSLGPVIQQKERSRDIRMAVWLDSLRADAVFGWRQLNKNKVTSAAAILSLALAIGSCTSAFRLIDAMLLRPLPVAAADRLYSVAFRNHDTDGRVSTYDSCSYPMFLRMREAVKDQAESIAVSYAESVDLTYGSDPEMEKAYRQYVSGWMFPSFGLRPAAGRLFTASDDVTPGANPIAVLSHDYWMRRFSGDPKVVGRTFRIGADLFQIIGVAQAPFTGTETGRITEIFLPMMMKNPRTLASASNFWLRTFVQLKPGVASEPVYQRLDAVFRAIQQERAKGFPVMPKGQLEQFFSEKMFLDPATAGRSNLQRDYRQALVILGVLVALVLLIACANVANLMTARATARAREMALRMSIGAGRWRLVQLVLMEGAWLALLATTIGALFAWWSAPFIVGMINPPDNPARLILPADWRVLGFAMTLAAGVTFLFGLTPALRASAVKPASAMKGGEDPHSRRRVMYTLIATQVAFCCVVHFVAGLFVATFDRLSHQPTGFSADRILNLETVTSSPQLPVYWDQVAEHLRATPGVERVALTIWPMMSGEGAVDYISINGAPPSDVFSDFLTISPGWIETMKIALLDGRDFRANDTNPSVAIVNQAFVKQFFGGENPVGKSFERLEPAGRHSRYQVVGLVHDARSRHEMRRAIRATAYVPFQSIDAKGALRPMSRGTFVIRTASSNSLELSSALRREVSRARSEFRVTNLRPQEVFNQSPTVRERLLATLALFFAGVALLLAGVGLYGVLDYSVHQRRREIGIRMAIGARAANIALLVTLEVFAAVASGALVGLALGMATARYIETLLFEAKPTDVAKLTLPLLAIFAAAILAALPAVVRAIRIDPVAMLRSE